MVESSEGSIGNLGKSNNPINRTNVANRLAWDSYSPFGRRSCQDCAVFPICLGSCPWYPVVKTSTVCSPLRYNIIDLVRLRASLPEDADFGKAGCSSQLAHNSCKFES
jgi:radical SAM protein with 4Fe4S-binding SPASM domain